MVAMRTAKILVVDDDPAIRTLIHRFLSKHNYEVESAEDGKTALQLFDQFHPDLVILDVNLPDAIGFDLCETMQSRTNVLVLMLTSRVDEQDMVRGLESGADYYVTKPFRVEPLRAIVERLLKRRRTVEPSPEQSLTFADLSIDPLQHIVTKKEEPLTLTPLEFDLLYFFGSHPNRVWTRKELLQEVWGYDYVGDERVVDVHIGHVRQKIEDDPKEPKMILTIRGVGYKFESES